MSKRNINQKGKTEELLATSLLQDLISSNSTSQRDALIRIGMMSSDFSLMHAVDSQESFGLLVDSMTPRVIDALSESFV